MRVLKDKDRVLYDKLVRLAGGNSDIVIKVLSNPHRSSVGLRTAIKEIEACATVKNREQRLPFPRQQQLSFSQTIP